jgi:hypothetical protein
MFRSCSYSGAGLGWPAERGRLHPAAPTSFWSRKEGGALDFEDDHEFSEITQAVGRLAAERSRKYVAARTARRWLMDELQCADFEAEAALWKRVAAGFPVYFENLYEFHVNPDGDVLESSTTACRHPYDRGRTSLGLKWLAENAQQQPHGAGTLSWETGDFCLLREEEPNNFLKSPWDEKHFVKVQIIGLRFKRAALIESFSLSSSLRQLHDSQPEIGPVLTSKAKLDSGEGRGRPLAEWWPDFVAELAAYVSEGLLPDGIGHQGQGEVFSEVSARLVRRDKLPPDRTQTQEAINAVLRRMRSAGK